jgi:UrcA family protein
MIRRNFSPFGVTNLMLAAVGMSVCGIAGTSSMAFAQAGSASPEASEQVIIHAPEIVRKAAPRRGTGTLPNENPQIITLSRAISYADLNLSKASDVSELETRVRNTAREVCQELDRQFPKSAGEYVRGKEDCVQRAVNGGLQQVRQVTAAR